MDGGGESELSTWREFVLTTGGKAQCRDLVKRFVSVAGGEKNREVINFSTQKKKREGK